MRARVKQCNGEHPRIREAHRMRATFLCVLSLVVFDVAAEMNLPRYKYVVQVVIGEQRGEGVRMGSRCFWDSETDNVANETYVNVRRNH